MICARDADDFHLLSKTLGAAGALPASAWINPAVLFARFPHARRNPPRRLVFFTAILPQFIEPQGTVGFHVFVLRVSSVVIELVVLSIYVANCQAGLGWARHPRGLDPAAARRWASAHRRRGAARRDSARMIRAAKPAA